MKKNYVKPQIVSRNTRVKNYIICASPKTQSTTTREMTWQEGQLTKDRNTSDDIWGSDSNEESVW